MVRDGTDVFDDVDGEGLLVLDGSLVLVGAGTPVEGDVAFVGGAGTVTEAVGAAGCWS